MGWPWYLHLLITMTSNAMARRRRKGTSRVGIRTGQRVTCARVVGIEWHCNIPQDSTRSMGICVGTSPILMRRSCRCNKTASRRWRGRRNRGTCTYTRSCKIHRKWKSGMVDLTKCNIWHCNNNSCLRMGVSGPDVT